MSNTDPLIVTLTMARLSFPVLFEKKSFRGGEGKPAFSATFLLDKKTCAGSIKKVQAAIDFLVKEEFGGKKLPPDRVCLKDGSTKPDVDGYGDDVMFVASRNEKGPVGVVDRDLSELHDGDGKPYAGCMVNATIRLWAQGGKSNKSEFGKRINATLRNVQFVKDGEPFGEKPATPEDDGFKALTEEEVL